MIDESNDIEFEYSEISLNKRGIGQDNIKVLFFDVGQEQVIKDVELFLFSQSIRKQLNDVKHEYRRA